MSLAQTTVPVASYSSLTTSAVTAGQSVNQQTGGINYHQLTWTVSGSPASCTVALDKSTDGVTWTAGGAIAGQTCTSNGSSAIVNAVFNYVRINVTALSASSSISVVYDGWVSNPAPSGGGTGCISSGTSVLKGDGSGGCSNAVSNTDFAPVNAPILTNPVVGTQAATDNSTKAASTSYVTTAVANAIAAVNPAVAVDAATAAVLPNSPTYNNGVAGIGATLTTATTNTPLVVDGYTPVLNDRVLVKNQASAFQNGVYTVTQVSGVGLAWILTRALDYDAPSDMNETGVIPVENGTANIRTQWVLTSKVNTVGTDSATFTQFAADPTTLITTSTSAGGTLGGTYPNPTLKRICEVGLGDGLNAIPAGTYKINACFNDLGATYTINAIRAFTDNNGTSTLNAANDAATGLLTGAVTATTSFASGTQSGTTTIATSHWIVFTFVSDGTSKTFTGEVTLTR